MVHVGHEYLLFQAAVVLYDHSLHNSSVISDLRTRALFHLYDANHDEKLEVAEVRASMDFLPPSFLPSFLPSFHPPFRVFNVPTSFLGIDNTRPSFYITITLMQSL